MAPQKQRVGGLKSREALVSCRGRKESLSLPGCRYLSLAYLHCRWLGFGGATRVLGAPSPEPALSTVRLAPRKSSRHLWPLEGSVMALGGLKWEGSSEGCEGL